MKDIILFTQNTMASIVAIREVLRKNPSQIKAIVLANQLKGESLKEQITVAYKLIKKSSLIFFGYKLIESKLYNLLLLAHKFFKTTRYQNGEAKSIEELAVKYNIQVIKVGDLSNQQFLEKIKQENPRYILCLVSQILKKNVFETLGNRLVNAHGSYLPEYRGAAQYVFYLLNGDQQFGVTIHLMRPGLDTGPIIFQRKFDYDHHSSAYQLHHGISVKFGELFNEFIEKYSHSKELPAIEQDESKATFTRLPLKEDLLALNRTGHRLITIRDFFSYL